MHRLLRHLPSSLTPDLPFQCHLAPGLHVVWQLSTSSCDQKKSMGSFDEFKDVPASVKQGLSDVGFVNPSEIQRRSIPHALKGENIIAQAGSGTGKTVAFAVACLSCVDVDFTHPAQWNLAPNKVVQEVEHTVAQRVQCLVLCPTREIAVQGADEMTRIGWHRIQEGLSLVCLTGGVPLHADLLALRVRQPHIVVATTGRLLSLIQDSTAQSQVKVANHKISKAQLEKLKYHIPPVRMLVFEEADRLLSENFRDQTLKLVNLVSQQRTPQPPQCLFYSATFPVQLLSLCQKMVYTLLLASINSHPKKRARIDTPINEPISEENQPTAGGDVIEKPATPEPPSIPIEVQEASQTRPVPDLGIDVEKDVTSSKRGRDETVLDDSLYVVVDGVDTDQSPPDDAPAWRILRKCFVVSSYIAHKDDEFREEAQIPKAMIPRSGIDDGVPPVELEAPVLPNVQCSFLGVDEEGPLETFITNVVNAFDLLSHKDCLTTEVPTPQGQQDPPQSVEGVTDAAPTGNGERIPEKGAEKPAAEPQTLDLQVAESPEETYNAPIPSELCENPIVALMEYLIQDKDWDHWPDLLYKFLGAVAVIWMKRADFKSCCLFCNDAFSGQKIATTLCDLNLPAAFISSRMNQAARLRHLQALRCGELKVLVCSDVLARGIDVPEIDLVLCVDLPHVRISMVRSTQYSECRKRKRFCTELDVQGDTDAQDAASF
eukprot:Protomagalhaensia_sp_Gyna_25__5408@NODE_6_length_9172_cov_212_725172_g5_i0_p1_GENE_NODE_6_length_9172_cov_212_725172_g5_i0NODE_6_length_9172_cov_212_725172_g5_i0_p1_ORF_typecomplete_len715_score100_68DEAD/PF00270_29/1_9e32Helicase_C/PF00271_31/6_8e02Helicase_C/PF00271_31/2_1e13ResIII/PF04851_15/4_1e08ERCC3_RAD25_C/PF16203_5/2_1e05AAA_19/PF13245_6/0_023AAA_11/PF13086_6/0_048L51_S25_CIB8/PF05047_16/6_3L51_S25_CIB8/PF05047_16/62_NODE_6_length_9172_cov_212_725172_g5_i018964040